MKVFGLIGEKLGHSLSPLIHQMIYEMIGLDASYSLFQVQAHMLKPAVYGIRALGINGVNVTIPYKIKLMEYLDELSPEAQKIGAVNTILNDSSFLTGYNTDYTGFGRMLDRYDINVANNTAIVLGTGGAARSITACLEDKAVRDIYIVTRDHNKNADFGKTHNLITYEELSSMKQGGLLVNCTPVGMYPNMDASPLSQEQVSKFDAVVDLIYNPSCTLLMQHAKNAGIPAYNGLYMLVSQAVAAVEIWNRIHIPDQVVDTIFDSIKERFCKDQ